MCESVCVCERESLCVCVFRRGSVDGNGRLEEEDEEEEQEENSELFVGNEASGKDGCGSLWKDGCGFL